ncbi:hypothetical protein PMIT1327_00902 [Prochlorococcus marinus str. MIT 1327]|nr:hypothetical protein PMIT1312_01134 [Prochlorococcus marinus str. MIT 1312]KZR82129.1 hypothetical protein PMIT1327_00902 [Prochlorococcus marinus str. MIT 1327]
MLIPLFDNDATGALFVTAILLVYRLIIARAILNLNGLLV